MCTAIDIVNDNIAEREEQFFVQVSISAQQVIFAHSVARVIITDDDDKEGKAITYISRLHYINKLSLYTL